MPQDPARKLSLQMSQSPLFPPGILMQSSLHWHSDPERSLGPQVPPGPPTQPSIPRHPDPPTLGTRSVHSSHRMPSSSSLSSGCGGFLGPMVPSEKYSDQQVRPEGPRKQRKERTIYSKEQKLLLQKHFGQYMYPNLEQRAKLALLVGVTEYEIQIWFKNQRARHKKKNPKNVKEELPESTGNSKDVSVSSHSCGHLSVLVSTNIESMSPGTSTLGYIPKLNPSMAASPQYDQAVEDAGCSSQEDLPGGQAPAVPPNLGKPTVVEAQTDPAGTDGPVSLEAPVPTTAAARSPDDVQLLHPPSETLWKLISEDLYVWEGS